MPDNLQQMYDRKYTDEQWSLPQIRQNATSTTRYDDTARLLSSEPPGGTMLEIGCGSGKLTMALADMFDNVIGFDLSPVRINTARESLQQYCPHLRDKMTFETGDGDQPFPFQDDQFDAIVLCAVLEHVIEPFDLMDQAARVCKKGGCIVVCVPNICYIRHVKDLLLGRVPLTGAPNHDINYWREHGWDAGHLHYFSKAQLTQLLRHTGFEPEQWTGDGKYAKLRRWHTNLVGNLTVRARRI